MPEVFISHASEDHEEAAQLGELLQSSATVFLDYCKPSAPLPASWRNDVWAALDSTRLFIAIVGTGHHEKPYYQFELLTALERSSRTGFPLLVPIRAGKKDPIGSSELDALNLHDLGRQRVAQAVIEALGELRATGCVSNAFRDLLEAESARNLLENMRTFGGPAADAAATLKASMGEGKLPPSKPFTARSMYPLSRLARQLPPEKLVEPAKPLRRLLTETDDHGRIDYERILHGAHLWGSLYSPTEQRDAALAEFHSIHHYLHALRHEITAWPMVSRQLLYTEVQLGDEAARVQFLKALATSDGAAFDIAYNFRYYNSGDLALMERRFKKQLPEERLPGDAFVEDVLKKLYPLLLDAINAHSSTLRDLRPERWPIT